MDSVTAKEIANQKVTVKLKDVLSVQKEFIRLTEAARTSETNKMYARGMAKVIKELGIPIDLPNGFNL